MASIEPSKSSDSSIASGFSISFGNKDSKVQHSHWIILFYPSCNSKSSWLSSYDSLSLASRLRVLPFAKFSFSKTLNAFNFKLPREISQCSGCLSILSWMLFLSISLFSPIFPSRFPSSGLDTLIFGIAFWIASKHLLDFPDFIPSLLFRFINLRLKNDISLLVPTVEHQFLELADQLNKILLSKSWISFESEWFCLCS